MKYGLTDTQLQEIIAFIEQYADVEQAILFGSRAMGTFKEASDVDIALKGEKVTDSLAQRIKFDIEEDTYLPFFFDVIAYPSISNEALIKHIDDKGVVIFRRWGEWRECKLGEIATKIGSGATPRGGSNSYKEAGISLIRSQNILDFKFSNDGLAFIDNQQADELKNVAVEKNDVLLNITGDSVARCCIVPNSILPARVNQHVAIIRLNPKKAIYLFIFYFLQFKKEELLSYSEIGGTRRALTKGMIEDFDVSLPDLPEQKSIAAVLSSLDDKIDLLHRQNKTLEAMAETLFRQWFIEPACASHADREAREDWEEGKLGDEFDFTMGQSPSGSSFNEDGVGVPMFQGNADFGFRFPSERVYTTEPTRFAKPMDTLISVRAPVGAQNMAQANCCIGRGLAAFRYKVDKSFYTYTYFKLRSMMEEIKRFDDEGTVFGSISKSDFEGLQTSIPPLEMVRKFETEAKPINDKVIHNCHQIESLETLRDTLLPKLMSGEVRVKVA